MGPNKFSIKDLYGFNLALLWKQGWKFISNLDALVSRLFKAKYFPNGDFLGSSIGHNPSYVWRSIWNSRVLLQQGYRWCIGDGSNIQVWNKPWLRDPIEPAIQSQNVHTQMRVSELMIPGTKMWNHSVIDAVFEPQDAAKVKQVPLLQSVTTDKRIWAANKQGVYTVNSAYWLYGERLASRNHLRKEGNWSIIWHMKIPPKVKVFLWRACRDVLPTRLALQRKGVDCPSICVQCERDMEICWHIFLTCPQSIACWKEIQIWHLIESQLTICESFLDLFMQVCSLLDTTRQQSFVMTLWSIWNNRNNKLWEAKACSAKEVVFRASHILSEWTHAKVITEIVVARPHAIQCDTWTKPPQDIFKCNIDAAFHSELNRTGFGFCIRDHNGEFLAARSAWLFPMLQVIEGEAAALLNAIYWLNSMEVSHVILESDYMTVVHDLQCPRDDVTEYGSIINHCRRELANNPGYTVQFARRQANSAAHSLARVAFSLTSDNVFYTIPDCIAQIIINEMK